MPLPDAVMSPTTDAPENNVEYERSFRCDHCDQSFDGEPAGSGLLVWTRGEEVRYEEPPLCEECASSITTSALLKWEAEEEEEG